MKKLISLAALAVALVFLAGSAPAQDGKKALPNGLNIMKQGLWINKDSKNDVHIHTELPKILTIAVNDASVYSGKGVCPKAVSVTDEGKILVQFYKGESRDIKAVKIVEITKEELSTLLVRFLDDAILTASRK